MMGVVAVAAIVGVVVVVVMVGDAVVVEAAAAAAGIRTIRIIIMIVDVASLCRTLWGSGRMYWNPVRGTPCAWLRMN